MLACPRGATPKAAPPLTATLKHQLETEGLQRDWREMSAAWLAEEKARIAASPAPAWYDEGLGPEFAADAASPSLVFDDVYMLPGAPTNRLIVPLYTRRCTSAALALHSGMCVTPCLL
jgi:hypothetical protein